MMDKKDWSEYYEVTRDKPPFSLLINFVEKETDNKDASDEMRSGHVLSFIAKN